MSTRGGYGFVLNNKEIIIYTGGGADLDGLGYAILKFLKNSTGNLEKQVLRLSEVDSEVVVTEQDIASVHANTGVTAYTKHNDPISTWYHLLYPGQNYPEYILDAGFYIDGSWIIDSIDLEFFYLINLDTQEFEVYHGYNRPNPNHGWFSGRASENGGNLPTLLATYPLDSLPSSLYQLEEKLYE